MARPYGIPWIDEDGLFEVTRHVFANVLGLGHQKVLGTAPGWCGLGSNGGGVDLRTVDGVKLPRWGKPGLAEVKSKYNPIKSSDEKALWQKLERLTKPYGAVAYLIQVIPSGKAACDKPWSPSGVIPRETVRCCDGVTGYAMLFGHDRALHEPRLAFRAVFPSEPAK